MAKPAQPPKDSVTHKSRLAFEEALNPPSEPMLKKPQRHDRGTSPSVPVASNPQPLLPSFSAPISTSPLQPAETHMQIPPRDLIIQAVETAQDRTTTHLTRHMIPRLDDYQVDLPADTDPDLHPAKPSPLMTLPHAMRYYIGQQLLITSNCIFNLRKMISI